MTVDESLCCHQAGVPHAALASLAGAFEGVLLGAVVAHEGELRAAGLWPVQPSRLHLTGLVRLARRARWLSQPIEDEIIEILNKVRNMAAHLGAYVRGARQVPELDLGDSVGYGVVYDIVTRASKHLFAVLVPASLPGTTLVSDD
jgi:hypothetical protein